MYVHFFAEDLTETAPSTILFDMLWPRLARVTGYLKATMHTQPKAEPVSTVRNRAALSLVKGKQGSCTRSEVSDPPLKQSPWSFPGPSSNQCFGEQNAGGIQRHGFHNDALQRAQVVDVVATRLDSSSGGLNILEQCTS